MTPPAAAPRASEPDGIRAEIGRLAAELGCEAFLLAWEAKPAEVTGLLEEIATRLDAGAALVPHPAPEAKAPRLSRFRITDRDRQVLEVLARYRYLRTGQIHRLVFAPQAGLQMTRRRLRFLAAPDFGYLQKVEFFGQGSTIKPESAYFLGAAGLALLAELGLPPPAYAADRPGRVRHRFLEHALELSEFRLKLELTLRNLPFLRLQRFTAEFEVKEHLQNATSRERFKLYYAFPGGARRLVVYPDALVILRHEESGAQRLYFVEIDRGTEGAQVLRDKAAAYQLYHERDIHKKFGDFRRFRVLLQAPSEKHAGQVRRALSGCKGEELFWTAAATEVSQENLLTQAVWTDSAGKRQSIFSKTR